MYSILITDDEKWIRKGIIAKLKYNGFKLNTIYEACDGEEALSIIKEFHPQIVITDVRMPNLDGIELLKEAKESYSDIKFIMISGFDEFDYVYRAMNLGAKGYILKPISNENLLNTMQKLIEELDEEARVRDIINKEKELKKVKDNYEVEHMINEIFSNKFNDNISDVKRVFSKDVDYKYIISIVQLNYSMNEDIKNYLKTIKSSIKEILYGTEFKSNYKIINNLNGNNQLFVIFYDNDSAALKNCCEEFVLKSYNTITKAHSVDITISLSDVGEDISYELYVQAKKALQLRLISEKNRVFKYSDIDVNNKSNYIYPEGKFKMLNKCIESHDLANVRSILKDIFSSDKISSKNYQYINTLYSECVNMMVKICNHDGIDLNNAIQSEMISSEKLSSYNTSEALVEDLYNMINNIINCSKDKHYDSKRIVEKTQKYIQEHYSEEIIINELAQRFSVNPTYYSNLFSKETGLSLCKYITKVRMENACRFLLETSINVSDISACVGFQDFQYFYRVFKKQIKMTPSEYRNRGMSDRVSVSELSSTFV